MSSDSDESGRVRAGPRGSGGPRRRRWPRTPGRSRGRVSRSWRGGLRVAEGGRDGAGVVAQERVAANRAAAPRRRGSWPPRRGRGGGAPRRAHPRPGPSGSRVGAASASSSARDGSPWSASNRASSRSTVTPVAWNSRISARASSNDCSPRRRRRPAASGLAERDDVLGQRQDRGRPLELSGGLCEVAPADRQPTQAGDRRGVVGDERRAPSRTRLRASSGSPLATSRLPSSAVTYAVFSGARPGDAAAWRIASRAPGEVAVELADVRDAGERRQVRGQPTIRFDLGRRLRVAAELDQRVDDHAVRRRRSPGRLRRGLAPVSRAAANSWRPSWSPPSPTSARMSSGASSRAAARAVLGRGVERRVGRLADALEQGEAEVPLRGRVVRVRRRRVPAATRSSDLGRRKGCRAADAVGAAEAAGVGIGAVVGGGHRRPGRERRRSRRATTRHHEEGGKGQGQSARPREHAVDTGHRHRPDDRESLEDAARVQDAERIERRLDRAHDAHRVGAALVSSHSRLAMPMPCSPVIVPPRSRAAR